MKRRLKKSVVYSLFGLSFVFLLIGVILSSSNSKESNIKPIDYNYAYDIINKLTLPVVDEKSNTIIRPYNDSDIEIVSNYYDYQGDIEEQKKSLIYYQDTYMQNSGIDYSNKEAFDVVASITGEVTKVEESDLLGNIVEITNDNIVITYQSLSNISVKIGDKVTQGDIIAKAGTSNISSALDEHLHFEVMINNVKVDPEEYYDKAL